MLSNTAKLVLDALVKLGSRDVYKITTSNEILANLPPNIALDSKSIKVYIDILREYDYILTKFVDDETYCFILREKTNLQLEEKQPTTITPKTAKAKLSFLWLLLIFFASMFGSFMAYVLCLYIF
ncbi:MAG: hypothetical protein PHP83_04150 [Clostridia bacterium]|nr:hypothetical protein [Clostridia bacterium]